jgi:hypothetical protein
LATTSYLGTSHFTKPPTRVISDRIENRRSTQDIDLVWQYAFARATAAGPEAQLDNTVVWAVEFLEGKATSLKPQMTLRHPLGTTASGR